MIQMARTRPEKRQRRERPALAAGAAAEAALAPVAPAAATPPADEAAGPLAGCRLFPPWGKFTCVGVALPSRAS